MKIAFHTLGCKVNQYETEMLKERFAEHDHQIVEETEFADAYIINTCTVTSLADRKSRQYIRKMKKINPKSIVAVTGCYAQVSPEEVASIHEVDIVTGTNQKSILVELVENYHTDDSKETVRRIDEYEQLNIYEETGIITSMESRTRAYLKIQEGCNRFCSYCIIPYARGMVRSRKSEDVIAEAKSLIGKGFKELILTGINTALYGMEEGFQKSDADKEIYGIEIIIKALEEMEGDFRIRLSSLEPTVVNRQYVKRLLKYKRLCPHLHLSVQSGSDRILKLMNRRYDTAEYMDIVEALREHDEGYGITTDIIVGFPGETEEDFKNSLSLIGKVRFCRVHGFKYSKRTGTKAAVMKGHVSPDVKNKRSEELLKFGNEISKKFFESCIGQERTVLVEEFTAEKEYLTGYTENYIKSYIPASRLQENCINEFVKVRIGSLYKDGVLCEPV